MKNVKHGFLEGFGAVGDLEGTPYAGFKLYSTIYHALKRALGSSLCQLAPRDRTNKSC